MRDLIKQINQYFKDRDFPYLDVDSTMIDGKEYLYSHIENGDWKHDHLAIDHLVQEFFDSHPTMYIKNTFRRHHEGSEGDWYTEDHYWELGETDNKIEFEDPSSFKIMNAIEDDDTPLVFVDKRKDAYLHGGDDYGYDEYDVDDSINEVLSAIEYQLTYYENNACAERRPETLEDIENDWHEIVFRADSDIDAFIEAFARVYQDEEAAEDRIDDLTDINSFIEYLDSCDWGDGSPIILKLANNEKVLYDSGYTKESWKLEYGDYDDCDDSINEENLSGRYCIVARTNDGKFKFYKDGAFVDDYKEATIFTDMDEARSEWFDIDKSKYKRVFIPNYDESSFASLNENREDDLYDYKTKQATGDWDRDDNDPLLNQDENNEPVNNDSDPLANVNWTMYSIANREYEKKATELVRELARDGFMPRDSKYTGSKYYVICVKPYNNKGIWKAVQYSNTLEPRIIDITYDQATGREPLDDFEGLRRHLGKTLLPHNEELDDELMEAAPQNWREIRKNGNFNEIEKCINEIITELTNNLNPYKLNPRFVGYKYKPNFLRADICLCTVMIGSKDGVTVCRIMNRFDRTDHEMDSFENDTIMPQINKAKEIATKYGFKVNYVPSYTSDRGFSLCSYYIQLQVPYDTLGVKITESKDSSNHSIKGFKQKKIMEGHKNQLPGQLTIDGIEYKEKQEPYSLLTAIKHYFGERRKRVSNPSGQGTTKDTDIKSLLKHHYKSRQYKDVIPLTTEDHNKIHDRVFNIIQQDVLKEINNRLDDYELSPDDIAKLIQGIAYGQDSKMYAQKQADVYEERLQKIAHQMEAILKTIQDNYSKYLEQETFKYLEEKENAGKQISMNV